MSLREFAQPGLAMNRQSGSSRGGPAAGRCALLAVAMVIAGSGALSAQPLPPGRLEVSGTLQWIGAMGAGGGDATETSPSGSPYRLFATRSTLGPAVGGEGQIAVRVARLVDVGFSTSFARSSLKTELTSDVEGIPDTEAAESISQVTFQGSVLVNLPSWELWGGVPFASGGAGYLRHLHEGRTLSEAGAIYHLGGGLTYLLTTGGGLFRSTGLRASARAVIRTDGAAFDGGSHVSPGFGVTFFGRF